MNWSGLDVAVVALFVAQALFVAWLAATLLTMKSTAQRTARRVGVVVKAGVAVAETGQTAGPALARSASALVARVRGLRGAAQFPPPPEGFLITPQTLQKGYSYSQGARRLLAAARRQPVAPGRRRKSVPERLGLVPPIALRLGWLWRGGRAALSAYRASRGGAGDGGTRARRRES